MNTIDILGSLHRNGTITERARLAGRSLTGVERNIIYATRRAAAYDGFNMQLINISEMEGQLDHEIVTKPLEVKAVFAYYYAPYEEIPATACYYILDSNHPALPIHGNVEADSFIEVGLKIPKTPTYEKWVRNGKKCFRGGK